MDINSFNLNGRRNEYLGLVFTIQNSGNGYVLSFYLQKLQQKGLLPLTVTMYIEHNHRRPHVHINKGRQNHIASVSLEGEIIEGQNNLSRKERTIIQSWISQHKRALYVLWDCISHGRDYTLEQKMLQDTWEYNEFCYDGKKPDREMEIGNIKIWYNGNIQKHNIDNGRLRIICTEDICVYCPTGCDEQYYLLDIEGSNVQSNVSLKSSESISSPNNKQYM